MVKKRGLGRGLDALLGAAQPAAEEKTSGATSPGAVPVPAPPPGPTTSLPVDVIKRGRYQPRRNFDEDKLRELADSISAQTDSCSAAPMEPSI